MNKLGPVKVGGSNPVRIMGILNTSPESFYKKSIKRGDLIKQAASDMEQEGADFIDVGGMSTAPYLSTIVSEKEETTRVLEAIKQIHKTTNLPVSVDTCRSEVARASLNEGAEILNDISGLKFDPKMPQVIARFDPSLVLCAYGKAIMTGNLISRAKELLRQSVLIATRSGIGKNKIVLDPAIGFFRRTGRNLFFTKIKGSWFSYDLQALQNIEPLKMGYPILTSSSNKSFIGKIIDSKDVSDRLIGSLTSEAIAVVNGADIIRTHNVAQTMQVIHISEKIRKQSGKAYNASGFFCKRFGNKRGTNI